MIRTCRICGNSNQNEIYIAREMAFGYRDEFEYFQCSRCGCLQISEIPKDLDKYYPEDYYSFNEANISKKNPFKYFLKRQRLRYYLEGKGIIGKIMDMKFGHPELPDWMKPAKLKIDSKILDVGCGTGHLLVNLKNEGFSHLAGVDPYIAEDLYYRNGVTVFKRELWELEDEFNFIMLHHSLEHIADPRSCFQALYDRIVSDGLVLIRIPTVSSFAWKKYKTNWVQLDAPRHLCLHSIKSVDILAEETGFKVENIKFDSTAFQFLGSEQYIKNIPLLDERSYLKNMEKSIFTENDIEIFKKKAKALNETKEGDQVCFYLRKINPSPN